MTDKLLRPPSSKAKMTYSDVASSDLFRIAAVTDVGPIIRARRRMQLLRIDDAAALSGVSVDLLSRLENGRGSVRLDKLLAVLDSLGLALVIEPKDRAGMLPASRHGA